MLLTYYGYYQNFLGDAFFNATDVLDIDLISNSATQVVLEQPESGIVTTLTGTGFTFSGDDPTGGTITVISFETADGDAIAEVSGISWGLVAFNDALAAIDESDNGAPMAALFSSSAITIDANGAFDMNDWDLIAPHITADMTITGSPQNDNLYGGAGDDAIDPGANEGYGQIHGSAGDDSFDFGLADEISYYDIIYDQMETGITATVDAAARTATVTSNGDTDTFANLTMALTHGGIGIIGSTHDDTFNITLAEDAWVGFGGGAGNDTYNVTVDGGGRLFFNWDGIDGPDQGVVADLTTGVISNDGLGGTDQLNILGGAEWLEIRTTDHNDSILGSARGESFILEQGDDTLDGGGGTDRVRYDRSGVTAVEVDLDAGTTTGLWDGNAFTHHLSNVEYIRGSLEGNDTLLGQNGVDIFEGRGGNDSMNGHAGDDRLYGEDGADTLIGEDGNDTLIGGSSEADLRDLIYGGNGADDIDGGYGNDELRGDAGNDTMVGGFGADTVLGGDDDDSLTGQAWGDLLFGGNGDDFINGGYGYDRVNGGDGADAFFHLGVAGHGSDWIQDYDAAEGDYLQYGGSGASLDQFRVNYGNTDGAGSADVDEAFVIYQPTGQILWALVDGGGQEQINVMIGSTVYDLLA